MQAEEDTPTTFPLRSFPDELIVRIIKHAVTISSPDDPIEISKTAIRRRVAQPAIIRTCHFFRNEGLQHFYTNNYFLITVEDSYGGDGRIWLQTLPRNYLPWLQNLYLGRTLWSWGFAGLEWRWILNYPGCMRNSKPGKEIQVKVASGKIAVTDAEGLSSCFQVRVQEKLDHESRNRDFTGWVPLHLLDQLRIPLESKDFYILDTTSRSERAGNVKVMKAREWY